MTWLLIAAGGGLGAMTRYGVVMWMKRKDQPYFIATFLVNSIGSLLMGMALHLGVENTSLSAFFTIGFLGAFTTFSTFAFDVVKLIEERDFRAVLLYPLLTLFAGIILVTLGWQIFA
ncbi:fluoride efflux transporter CrcB [Viridibacillus sp. YIM B01967]|uniref:Fluoride-specific ion channel FluC n=1 Tax=Viridibacillus soli TaxID=2798301 RepID=A0ABS1H565_9BACL|nr:fluoride efflux transporter CrcB [Viridibacillus soli]MBK3494555.1 fluoride efflux transporter CrcB [Viridibacillus soli]